MQKKERKKKWKNRLCCVHCRPAHGNGCRFCCVPKWTTHGKDSPGLAGTPSSLTTYTPHHLTRSHRRHPTTARRSPPRHQPSCHLTCPCPRHHPPGARLRPRAAAARQVRRLRPPATAAATTRQTRHFCPPAIATTLQPHCLRPPAPPLDGRGASGRQQPTGHGQPQANLFF